MYSRHGFRSTTDTVTNDEVPFIKIGILKFGDKAQFLEMVAGSFEPGHGGL
jgi:hypothetical protein